MGFFDDYKLKTPEDHLEHLLKSQIDPEKRLSMKGHKGEETGHMDDMIVRN